MALGGDNFLQSRCKRVAAFCRITMYAMPGMFRATISKLSLRKKLTILVSVGVFLPVLVLTYMQYRSLAELQNKTKGAFKDNLRQGFTILQRQMKQRLEDVAAQTLNPLGNIQLSSLSSLSSSGDAEEIEKYFANVKHSHPEIEEIFAFTYSEAKQETKVQAYLYSDKFVNLAQAEFAPLQSHILSVFDRSRTAQSFLDANRNYLFANDSCPTCPPGMREGTYLFYPLKNPTTARQSGFAGVLLTEGFVRDDLIARTIERLSTNHTDTFPAIAITISDDNKRVLYSNAAPQNGYLFESNFDRPFSNWKAGVGLRIQISMTSRAQVSCIAPAQLSWCCWSYFVASLLPSGPLTAKPVWRKRNQLSSQMFRMN
jgi:hypothetical protein